MAVKTVRLALNGEFTGQHADMRAHIRVRDLREMSAGDFDRQAAALGKLFVAWELLDVDTGTPIPQPSDGGVDDLTLGQVQALTTAVTGWIEQEAAVPKA